MSLYELFETNVSKEQDGVWIEKGRNADGSIPGFLIAAQYKTNKRYQKEMERISNKHGDAIRAKRMTNEEAEQLYIEAFAKTCVLDMRNVQDKGGVPIVYSVKNTVELLKSLPRLYDALSNDASNIATFQDEAKEENAGN